MLILQETGLALLFMLWLWTYCLQISKTFRCLELLLIPFLFLRFVHAVDTFVYCNKLVVIRSAIFVKLNWKLVLKESPPPHLHCVRNLRKSLEYVRGLLLQHKWGSVHRVWGHLGAWYNCAYNASSVPHHTNVVGHYGLFPAHGRVLLGGLHGEWRRAECEEWWLFVCDFWNNINWSTATALPEIYSCIPIQPQPKSTFDCLHTDPKPRMIRLK